MARRDSEGWVPEPGDPRRGRPVDPVPPQHPAPGHGYRHGRPASGSRVPPPEPPGDARRARGAGQPHGRRDPGLAHGHSDPQLRRPDPGLANRHSDPLLRRPDSGAAQAHSNPHLRRPRPEPEPPRGRQDPGPARGRRDADVPRRRTDADPPGGVRRADSRGAGVRGTDSRSARGARSGSTAVPPRPADSDQRSSRSPARARQARTGTGAPPAKRVQVRGYDPRVANAETVVISPGHRRARNLGQALLITLASAAAPGSGHLVLRRQTGWPILATFVLIVLGAGLFVTRVPRAQLLEYVLSTDMLAVVVIGCFLAAVAWLGVILRTYELARPRTLSSGKQVVGGILVFLLCLAVGAPFAFAGYTANSQRSLLNALFPTDDSNTPAGDAEAIKKPRINILLLGSDAGEGRIGTRTDTMVVASIDTRSGRTVLFGLPRNIAYAQFPPGSPMAKQFPSGFHDASEPGSGNYLLNAVYQYGNENPSLAPSGPSRNPGFNLLNSSISHMLGLTLDYYIQVNMAGFASIIDALGGLDVNVGPTPVPMGGIGPFGEVVKPFGYIPAGRQHLDGEQALWFARSRTNTSDYVRMGRQRCLLQYLVDQKSPVDVLKNFQAVSAATKDSVSTNIPQNVLPALVTLAGKAKERPLESISFDPNLPDPEQPDGRFNTGHPNFPYMRQVVRDAIAQPSSSTPPTAATTTAAPTKTTTPSKSRTPSKGRATATTTTTAATPDSALPVSLGEACNNTATE